MTPEEIVAKFAHALNNFELITGQPSDTNLTRLWEAVVPLLIHIPYDETGGKQNLISLIRPKLAYVDRYGKVFPDTKRVGAYGTDIDNNAMPVVRARLEAAHKAKCADRATFETARRETTQFVVAVVADIWVRELRDTDSLYSKVGLEDLFSHLQAGCTGQHSLDLLALHNEMQRYYLEVEGIPEYINMLKDAQQQDDRAGQTITDETLLLFASTAMLTSERFPRANNDWEDRAEHDKTWANWNTSYKQAHAKARGKAHDNDGSVKFGAANSAACQESAHFPLDNQLEADSGDLKTLKGYFDNLYAAAVNEQGDLKKLVLNNTTLAMSNESIVALLKK